MALEVEALKLDTDAMRDKLDTEVRTWKEKVEAGNGELPLGEERTRLRGPHQRQHGGLFPSGHVEDQMWLVLWLRFFPFPAGEQAPGLMLEV